MRSLSAHLRQPDQHARLPFHPECPICCRERLVGSLPSEGLISRRAQAAIAAGVLALSTAAPAGTYAQEPDQTNEGTSAPEEIGSGDPTHSPDFDPGGESTELPFDSPPTAEVEAPPDSEDADAGPLEQEPTTDVDVPVADGGDEPSDTGAQPETQPSSPPAQPPPAASPPATPTATPTPPPEAPTTAAEPPPPDTDDAVPADEPQSKATGEKPKERPDSARKTTPEPATTPEPGPAVPAAPTPEQTVPAAQATPAPVLAVSRSAGDRAQPGDRSHVVRPGESLWSIAADHLGDQPTVAVIAREVNRLWELNRERIGTGSPDLLMVGTLLTLR